MHNNKSLIWLIPFLFALHNAEEALNMTVFLKDHFKIAFITERGFILAVLLLSVTVFLFILLYQIGKWISLEWVVFIQGAIFFNALQHVVLFFILREYNPGLLTAVVNLVFSVMLYIRLYKDRSLSAKKTGWILAGSLLSYPLITWLALWLASLVE